MAHHAVQQLHDLADADLAHVEHEQQGTPLPHRQAHDGPPERDDAGQAHPDAPLSQHVLLKVHRSLVPFLTLHAPAFEDLMMNYLDRLRLREFDHFSPPCQADPSQPQMALRARDGAMLDDLGGHRTSSSSVVLRVSLLPWLLLGSCWLLHVLFDELWWLALLLQFLNTKQRQAQQFLHLAEFFQGLLV